MDPRRSGPGRASKAPLAPGARRLGAPASDSESLPSAPSPGCPDVSPAKGDSKRRKSSSPGSRRVVVAESRAAVLRQRGEERPRLTPANALVLRGRAEVEGRKKAAPEDSEPKRHSSPWRLNHDKLKGNAEKAKKAEKAKRSKEEQAPRKKQKAEQKVKQTGGSKHDQEVQDEKGDDGKKKKKKEKKEKKQKEKQRKDEENEEEKEEPQKPAEEPEEPSDAEVRPPSPPKPKSQNVKSKKEKEKKAEKNRNKSEKEKKKATSKHREPEKVEEKKDKASKKDVPATRRKEKKSKREAERSKSEDPPRQTADEPEAEAPRGGRVKASGRHRERQMEVEQSASETRDRRRRKERPRSESRSRHRRRRQRIFPPDAWQVWPAGSYHPWSSQLAGAPFGVWPMQSVPGDMSQAWIGNMQQPQVAAQESDSSEESEDLEGRELEAPKEPEEEEQEQSEEEEEEEEPELEQPILKSNVPVVPGILKTTVPQPILKTAPGILKTVPPHVPAQIAVPDDDDDDGSATTRTSEGEESETESQDEDAEIGEAPVARRPIIELGKGVEDVSMPKVKWYPPGPERPRAALHHSMTRWCGPKVGWMALYQLEIDPAVQMKSSVQQIREGDGKGVVDPDASEIEATSEANPSEAPVREEGPAVPLLIPRWGSTRGWASPSEVAVEDSLRWEKRKLSSNVLRSRRAGRSSAGGGGGANPQDPPEADPADGKPSGTSTFLIFLGTAARSVRILVEWRPPPALVLPEDVIVDPTKYRGVERNLRQKRRPKAAAKPAAAKKKAAVKSSPGTPPPKVQPVDPNAEYQAKLRALMQQLQDGSATADAVSSFWNSLSPANRVLFSSEFPQFMHLVQPDRGVQSKAATQPVQQAHMLPPTSVMHLPVPPPPKTSPPAAVIPVAPMAVPGMLAAPVAPVAWAKAASPQLTPEVIKQQEAAWANRLTFHDGILRADMSSLQLGDAGLARWCKWAPSLLKTLGSAGGAPLSNADLNFSGNALEDAGLRQLLDLLRSCDVHVRCLNLDANRLTEASLVAISDFIAELRLAVSAVHMKNNRVQGSYGIMHLARAIKSNDKYPMLSEKKRYTPLMLHLAGNMIDRPMQVTQLLKEALDNKFPSLSEDRQYWESKQQCPPLQLPCFDKQETSLFQ